MSPKLIRWIVFPALALIAVLLFWQPWKTAAPKAPDAPAPAGPGLSAPRLPVAVQVMANSSLSDDLTVSGALQASEEVDLASEVAGKVLKVLFKEGTEVREGQVLVKLQDDDLRANLQKLELQKDLALQLEQRRKRLLDIGGVSQEEYDQALTALRTAEAELELLKVNLSKTEIKAPFSGKIGFRFIGEGSYLSPGMRIARLVRLDPIHVQFFVPEKYATRIREGQPIRFQIEGKAEAGNGTVFAKAPSIDPVTRTLEVKARAANAGRAWVPGSFSQVTVRLTSNDEALVVNPIAVVSEIGGQSVFVYRNGTAALTPVQIGVRTAESVQLVGGVQPGDTVIVSGVLQLRNGAAVQVSEIRK